MDEKLNPEQEDDRISPEIQAEETDLPEIQELTFESTHVSEEITEEEEVTSEELPFTEGSSEEAPPEEAAKENTPVPEITAEACSEETPEEASIPEEIPTEESIPEDISEENPLLIPAIAEEITAHTDAMDAHGMLKHNEDSSGLDVSVLDDPELSQIIAESEDNESSPEELLDQEYSDNSGDFAEVYSTEDEPPAPPTYHPARKGRPKRKKGEGLFGIPNMITTAVWLAMILVTGVTLGRMLWVCAADVLAFGREDKVVTLTIYEADTMDDIVDKLYENGLIRYKGLFNLYASISDAEEEIKPGIYDLNTRYDYHALVNFMSPSSTREVVEVMIPEGYTCRQIFALLEENKVCTAVDLAAYAADGELDDYWFLQDVERGDMYCLEGFLFPDTYEFYKNDSPRNILQKMLNNFDYRFGEELQAQIDVLNQKVTGGTFTIREVVIVASLIEKETAGASESPKIASVIYNRLFDWGNTPAYLNIDASIIYAQNGESDVINTKLDSPYNTYTNIGLTPTPIANPGLNSLRAALFPADTNYYYYVLNPATWSHQFSTTLAEHENYRAKFAAASEG